jgi:hypothetical protein
MGVWEPGGALLRTPGLDAKLKQKDSKLQIFPSFPNSRLASFLCHELALATFPPRNRSFAEAVPKQEFGNQEKNQGGRNIAPMLLPPCRLFHAGCEIAAPPTPAIPRRGNTGLAVASRTSRKVSRTSQPLLSRNACRYRVLSPAPTAPSLCSDDHSHRRYLFTAATQSLASSR